MSEVSLLLGHKRGVTRVMRQSYYQNTAAVRVTSSDVSELLGCAGGVPLSAMSELLGRTGQVARHTGGVTRVECKSYRWVATNSLRDVSTLLGRTGKVTVSGTSGVLST